MSQETLRQMYKATSRTNRRAAGVDAVTPSVKGAKGVIPSTIGVAAQARFAKIGKTALVAAEGLDAILKIRDSAEAQADPELAALANDPKFIMVMKLVLEKLSGQLNGLMVEMMYGTSGTADGQGPDHENDEEVMAAANEKARTGRDPHVAAGVDSAGPILGADDMARVERARAKLSRLKTAQAMGDAGDIVRAQFGMEPRAVDADGLYAMFEGKRSK
ncbi:hypothetical protein [Paraburkholderia sp. BL6669N2]|uniref:hypothetical protein n=1 Tax=Paraburkholderia sp. BL6669N2 TaxID=1938807 RepID=UPI0011C06893|nr:hypothetical protein [Paraburkholderia sp. BL6669N2]